MAIYFEQKQYTIQEIVTTLNIKATTQLRRAIVQKMKALGFEEGRDYSFPKYSKQITILWIPQDLNDKIKYLVRLLNIDTRINPHDFALFFYGMVVTEDLQAMPWQERSIFMKDNWDIDISYQTLCSSWGKKLLEMGIITKNKRDGCWWSSFKIEGETYREVVITPEELETVQRYWADWREWKKSMSNKEVFTKLWGKYGCTYYKCPKLETCAWHEPIVEELMQVINDYVQEYWLRETQ